MTASDPAVAAAERTLTTTPSSPLADFAVAAADQALAPLRELHKRGGRCECCGGRDTERDTDRTLRVHRLHPRLPQLSPLACATARLVYAEAEL